MTTEPNFTNITIGTVALSIVLSLLYCMLTGRQPDPAILIRWFFKKFMRLLNWSVHGLAKKMKAWRESAWQKAKARTGIASVCFYLGSVLCFLLGIVATVGGWLLGPPPKKSK